MKLPVAPWLVLGLLSPACAMRADVGAADAIPDLAISRPPFETVHADWKERFAQRYAYVEHVGSYRETGRQLAGLFESLDRAGVAPSGPPFALFYDDPGRVPTSELRSRACVPVDAEIGGSSGVSLDVLPSATVVYALASGPYPDVPRAYPGLYAFLGRMGWVEDGPVREIYLAAPGAVASPADLLTEIQIPVGLPR